EWVHVQLHQQKGMISLSPPTICNSAARPQDTHFQDEMVEQYGRVKRFLSAMLRDLHFQAAPAGEHTLSAIHYLAELSGSKKRILDDAPEQIISGPWKRLVYDRDGRILRAGYSLCLLERLQDSLRRRDLWLENSDRWGDPRQKLLQGAEWGARRIRKKSYAKVFRASVRAETSRL
ncbi:hypothetical protein P2R69_23450, partial [Escherichia coli]